VVTRPPVFIAGQRRQSSGDRKESPVQAEIDEQRVDRRTDDVDDRPAENAGEQPAERRAEPGEHQTLGQQLARQPAA